jgi:GNAT superfamily N-acetyltransferase
MKITIESLIAHKEKIGDVAKLWHNTFASYLPYEHAIKYWENVIMGNDYPVGFIALSDQKFLGVCKLDLVKDFDNVLKHWIFDFVVEPEYRRCGVATEMINFIKQRVVDLGFNQLYISVFGDELPTFYKKFGWEEIEKNENLKDIMRIMVLKL